MQKIIKRISFIVILTLFIFGIANVEASDTTAPIVDAYPKLERDTRETVYEAYSTMTTSINGEQQTPVQKPGVYGITVDENADIEDYDDLVGVGKYTLIVTDATKFDAGHMYTRGLRLLPQQLFSINYGLLPQYFGKEDQQAYLARNVNLEGAGNRWDLATKRWVANINGHVVYCAGYQMPVKYAHEDKEYYILRANQDNKLLYTRSAYVGHYNLSIAAQKDKLGNKIKDNAIIDHGDSKKYEWTGTVQTGGRYGSTGASTPDKVFISRNDIKVEFDCSDIVTTDGRSVSLGSLSDDMIGYIQPIGGETSKGYTAWNYVGTDNDSDVYAYRQNEIRLQAQKYQTAVSETVRDMQNANAGLYGGGFYVGKSGWGVSPPYEIKPTKTADHGELMMVSETEEHAGDGYKLKATNQYDDNWYSFIFSSSENAYGTSDYSQKYTLVDIQSAYWLLLNEHDGGRTPGEDLIQPNGKILAKKADDYVEFLKSIKSDSYKAEINSSKAQVIVDRANQQYILGPYTLDYDYYEDINYVKALTITAGTKELVYAEAVDGKSNYDFKLILDGEGVSSNGMLKEYPNSGQSFFLLVDADKIGTDTTDITFGAKFEHIEKSHAWYEEYTSQINNYRYAGYYEFMSQVMGYSTGVCAYCGETHTAAKAELTITWSWPVGKTNSWTESRHSGKFIHDTGEDGLPKSSGHYEHEWDDEYTEYYNEYQTDSITLPVYVIYISQAEHKVENSQSAQPLTVIGKYEANQTEEQWGNLEAGYDENAWREYKVVEDKVNIDLSMELGGYVWVDENGGKEDVANGLCDQDDQNTEERVSNLIVRLYKQGNTPFMDHGGAEYLETKTNEKGEYRFTKLSPMYKYYVYFVYNGQYYEPTQYTSPYDTVNGWSNWKNGTWTTNSNATDIVSQRQAYNERFSTINSSTSNYYSDNYNQWLPTYTKMELLGYTLGKNGEYTPTPQFDERGNVLPASSSAAIDQFGNILNGNSDKIKYVVDSLTAAYTKNYANSDFDYYIIPDVFIIDNKRLDNTEYTALYSDSYYKTRGEAIANTMMPIYEQSYYINLGLHPRQEADVAVKKDVDKVTLEINNHTHEYTYDTLDSFKCNHCGYVGANSELIYRKGDNFRWALHCPECDSTDIQADWSIEVRLSDGYYSTNYNRELYKSDYDYKVSMYGKNAAINGVTATTVEDARAAAKTFFNKDQSDELEVYVTYKIRVKNESISIRTRIDELVDYYDETYQLVPERSYIEIAEGEEDNIGKYDIVLDSSSVCSDSSATDKVFIRGIGKADKNEGIYLSGGQSACFYVTFKVEKELDTSDNEQWIKLGNKDNLVELNGYSTRYEKGTTIPNIYDESTGYPKGTPNNEVPAGLVDVNSTPGNQDPNVLKDSREYIKENDTDKAPTINLKLYDGDDKTRTISGTIWEDERTETVQAANVADGKMASDETKINGVTVQLVEIMENGEEFVWREFGSDITGHGTVGNGTGSGTKATETPVINVDKVIEVNGENVSTAVPNYEFTGDENSRRGQYVFKSYMPGNYIVRYIYGDTVRTVVPNSLGGLNEKSYNGQDYKSTTYQTGIEQNKTYIWTQEPMKIVNDNGVYREWIGSTDPITNWEYGYRLYNGTTFEYIPMYISGIKQRAPELTEISTFKDDASNNETVTIPRPEEVTKDIYNKEAEKERIVIPVENQNGYLYDITKSEMYNGINSDYPNVSDAKDIESRRIEVNNYSDENVTNYISEVLASHKYDYNPTNNDRDTLLQDLMANTKMVAETGLMVVEFEYDDIDSDIKDETEFKRQGVYNIQNVNLGLEERPKAQLELNKEVTNVKVTLADGSVLFDAKEQASNVLWRRHQEYDTGYSRQSYKDGAITRESNFMDWEKFGSIQNIRDKHAIEMGLIQLTMDEEIMHGATITIDYKITVRNVGEVDYYETDKYMNIAEPYTIINVEDAKHMTFGTTTPTEITKNRQDRMFYYKGQVKEGAIPVTSRADVVMDYVANNLQFYAKDNTDWSLIKDDAIQSNGYVNPAIIADGQVAQYNTKIETQSLNTDLVPTLYKNLNPNSNSQDSVEVPLKLTQLITAENDSDDLRYLNIAEIVKTSNSVGRRNEYSVVGNQDPTQDPTEMDTDRAEIIKILPPFGEDGISYTIIAVSILTVVVVLAGALIIIKKVIIKK